LKLKQFKYIYAGKNMTLVILTSSSPKLIGQLNPSLIITNNPNPSKLDFPCIIIEDKNFNSRKEYDLSIKEKLDNINPDLIILADYNKIIKSPELLEKYKDKIINIHLSYLPNFPGYKAHEQAWKAKAKESGYTLHRINGHVDKGQILKQEKVDISDCKSPKEIKDKLSKSAWKGLKELIATL